LRNEDDDFDKAKIAYEKAISESPDYGPIYKGMGLLLYKKNLKEEAKPYFTKYLELSPDAMDKLYIKEYLERS